MPIEKPTHHGPQRGVVFLMRKIFTKKTTLFLPQRSLRRTHYFYHKDHKEEHGEHEGFLIRQPERCRHSSINNNQSSFNNRKRLPPDTTTRLRCRPFINQQSSIINRKLNPREGISAVAARPPEITPF